MRVLTLIATWIECFGKKCNAHLMTRAKTLDLNVFNVVILNPICSVEPQERVGSHVA